jgi:hypothetical protein
LLYLRARYYQPEVGRLITKDPWRGNTERPGTLNRYVYVTNNPVNWIDPGGLDGGGPRGLGIRRDDVGEPESRQYDIPGTSFSWPSEPEPDIPPLEEWVKEWPDPWIDDPKGWNWADELEASELKRELFRQSKEAYGEKYRLLVGYAFVRLNNPLRKDELGLCAGSGPQKRTLRNRSRPQWIFFISELDMDTSHTTNYEPLWLAMLMKYHERQLGYAQANAYKQWYVSWARMYGTEHEEIGHYYDLGVGEVQ